MTTHGPRFWLRWSLRDLRRRWPLIAAIGLLLAGGTGLAAGLGSMRDWRVDSNDASFAATRVHDLRVEAESGSFAPTGSLARAVRGIPDADTVRAATERLILPTQIDASSAADGPVVTPGQLVGVETDPGRTTDGVEVTGPEVDAVAVDEGKGLPSSGEAAVGVLDPEYAEENGIEPPARLKLAGGREVRVAGLGSSPETFVVLGSGGQFSSEAEFGTLFVPLGAAQRLGGRPGQVNDLAVALKPVADRAAIAQQLEQTIESRIPGFGVTITETEDLEAHRILYDDAENDQELFDVFAFLILAGAAFAAFNLISRTIEAQRREIGIGMALGVTPWRLAVRPLAMGVQIAVVGVLLGAGVGLAMNEWLRSLLADQLPLPILETGFRFDTFVQRAAIGFAIPLLAAAWPVRRGLRVTPIEAIRVGFRAARGGGLASLAARLPLPGTSLAQMPPRNVLRAPRRTVLTVLGSGAVVAVAVSMSGMLDSFEATVDRNAAEELRTTPDRLTVTVDRYYPTGSAPIDALLDSRAIARADTKLSVPAELRSEAGAKVGVVTETLTEGTPIWAPRVSAGRTPRGPRELLVAESAAEDLGVGPGDEITMVHPRRTGRDRFASAESIVRISGTHPAPFRSGAYVDPSAAPMFGLAGRTNAIEVLPRPGVDELEAKRSLAASPGVASIGTASALSESLDEGLDEFAAIIRVVVVIAMVLVLLIAFNSTAINADERAREHATMFAYGLPLRTVLRLAVAESLIIGLVATAIGVALGALILSWVVNVSLEEVLPELGVVTSLSLDSFLLAAVAGAGAMAAAPLLTVRRLRRMDVPSTLRVVE